jgi:acetyltransferase-like isoleucine patch superfamily enzyme
MDVKPTNIGNGVYIGPGSVIQMGVNVGDRAVIGALSLVNRDIPAGARAWGCPAVIRTRPENSDRITELSDHEPD